jgi:hypothetical protein
MFAGWSNFYMLLGTASAGLIGLLFVVATLTSTIDRDKRARGQSLFLTPVAFKFAAVLALSAAALAFGLPPLAQRLLAAAVGGVGLINLGGVSYVLVSGKWNDPALHWTDPWCYGVVPTLVFAGLAASAALPDPVTAGRCAAAAALVILLFGVRNAWDLVITLSNQPPPGET